MKKNTIIFWVATGLLGGMMLFSAYSYLTNPMMEAAFKHLGFPDHFRSELAVAKIIGAFTLLIPQVPLKIKEWAYAGFGITFIAAFVAHLSSGDPVQAAVMPLIFFAVLVVSNVFLYKKEVMPVIEPINNKPVISL